MHKGMNRPDVEITVAITSVKLVVTWFVAWTPYAIVALLGISTNGRFLTPINSAFPAMFAKLAACINPYIYGLSHPKIREEILKYFRKEHTSHNQHDPRKPIGSPISRNIISLKCSNSNNVSLPDLYVMGQYGQNNEMRILTDNVFAASVI